MKHILLLAAATAGLWLGGCRTVAVVHTPAPAVRYSSVSYSHGKPYYYSGRTRYWGYPPGYRSPSHGYGRVSGPGHHRRTVIRY